MSRSPDAHRGVAGGFALAVGLPDEDVNGGEELQNLTLNGCGERSKEAGPLKSKLVLQRFEDELPDELIPTFHDKWNPLATLFARMAFSGNPSAPLEHPLSRRRKRRDFL